MSRPQNQVVVNQSYNCDGGSGGPSNWYKLKPPKGIVKAFMKYVRPLLIESFHGHDFAGASKSVRLQCKNTGEKIFFRLTLKQGIHQACLIFSCHRLIYYMIGEQYHVEHDWCYRGGEFSEYESSTDVDTSIYWPTTVDQQQQEYQQLYDMCQLYVQSYNLLKILPMVQKPEVETQDESSNSPYQSFNEKWRETNEPCCHYLTWLVRQAQLKYRPKQAFPGTDDHPLYPLGLMAVLLPHELNQLIICRYLGCQKKCICTCNT